MVNGTGNYSCTTNKAPEAHEEGKDRKFLFIRSEGGESKVYKVCWTLCIFQHIFILSVEISHGTESHWMGLLCVRGPFPAVVIDITWYWLWADHSQQPREALRTAGLFSLAPTATMLNTHSIWQKPPSHRSKIVLQTWKPSSSHRAPSLGGNFLMT